MNQPVTSDLLADILIVDDRPNNLKLLLKMLADYNYKVRCAVSGAMALQAIQLKIPDLILLDITMPEMDGYQLCEKLKKDLQTRSIPVIFISALDNTFDKVKAFQIGGADYISKPFEIAEVMARIKNQLQLQQAQKQLKDFNNQLEQKVAVKTAQLQWEVDRRRQAQDKLIQMAMHDPLTNLANRTYLLKRLQTNIDLIKDSPDKQFTLLFLGCDRFQRINDSFGHFAGDQLLIAIANRLQSLLPQESLLARFGGDEFIVILESIQSIAEAIATVVKIQEEFSQPISFGSRKVVSNLSAGIVLATADYQHPAQILRDADIAMHQAKKSSVTTYQVFNQQMGQSAIANLQLETDLQLAIHQEELVLYYQPIICLPKKQVVGVEALVRWLHPKKGLILPNQFISIAEETNLILPLGMWVIKEACLQLASWQKSQKPNLTELEIEVNLSVKQLAQPNLVEQIEQIVQETGIERQKLKLEITETIFMEDVKTAQVTLNKLKSSGFQLILDDFGTGYSSLKYLQKLPISTIKIDCSFIQNLERKIHNQKIVEATIKLAHTLGLDVVAEGIENLNELEILENLGCDYGQGYLFSKPAAVKVLEEIITNF